MYGRSARGGVRVDEVVALSVDLYGRSAPDGVMVEEVVGFSVDLLTDTLVD